jgi:Tol biopolymer transport system component
MSEPDGPDNAGALSRARRVDAACLRFEAAWRTGGRPHIEDFLGTAPDPERPALLRELLHLELEYRYRGGESVGPPEYRARFPGHASLVEEVFASVCPAAGSGPEKVADFRLTVPEVPRPPGEGPLPEVPGYELLGVLGRGGMGVVYKARQTGVNRVVALKMILAGGHAGEQELQRFQDEAKAVAALQHPNIVQLYDFGRHDGLPFFTLEFVPAGSLADKLQGTPLPCGEAAPLVQTLARAMAAAHQKGVIHRDLKPANVLLTADGTPKITDFGLSRRLDEAGRTASGAVVGTPSYMAPEQARGQVRDVGPAADVYALGAILYECLTGRPPFRAATGLDTLAQVVADDPVPPRQLQPGTPRDLETICLKCLHKDRHQRYPTAEALAEDLRRFRAGEPIRAKAVGPVERARKWVRRRPAAAALLAVVVLGTLAGFALVWWRLHAEGQLRLAAETARTQEIEAGRREQRQRREAERNLYFLHLTRANREWNAGSSDRARDFLALCPLELRGWEWHCLSRLCRARKPLTLEPGASARAACFSPDNKRIATTADAGKVSLWDVQTGQEVLALNGHVAQVTCVAFSPDGRRLASAGAGVWDAQQKLIVYGEIKVWDAQTGKELIALKGDKPVVYSLSYSPDGKRLASSAGESSRTPGEVKVWDAQTGQELLSLQGLTQPVFAVCFSPDGNRLATVGGPVTVWDARTGRHLFSPSNNSESLEYAVCFSPDGKRLAYPRTPTGAQGQRNVAVELWDLESGQQVLSLKGLTGPVTGVCFSPDGKRIASGSWDQTVRVWDVQTGQLLLDLKAHTGPVWGVAFSPDGKRLAVAGWDRTVTVFDGTPLETDPVQPD